MRTPPPVKFPALGVGHRYRVGCLDEAVPEFFEEPQPIGNAQRLDLLADGAHGGILRFSFCNGKVHVSTHNAAVTGRGEQREPRSGGLRSYGPPLSRGAFASRRYFGNRIRTSSRNGALMTSLSHTTAFGAVGSGVTRSAFSRRNCLRSTCRS